MGTALAIPLIGSVGELVGTATIAAGKSALKSVTKSIFKTTPPALVAKVRQTADEEANKIVGKADEATQITVKAVAREVANAAMLTSVNESVGDSEEEAAETGADTAASAAKGTIKKKVKNVMEDALKKLEDEIDDTEDTDIPYKTVFQTEQFQNYKHFHKFLDLFSKFKRIFGDADTTPAGCHSKLKMYNKVVEYLHTKVSKLKEELEVKKHKELKISKKMVPTFERECDVLETMMIPLISGIGNLDRLSQALEKQKKTPEDIITMTDAEIRSLRRALVKINTVLGLLSGYIAAKKIQGTELLFPFVIHSDEIFDNQEYLQF